MRNLFDQYDQPENRLTHALASVLTHERRLLKPFLVWLGVPCVPRTTGLRVIEQQLPGDIVTGADSDARGLPDMCVFDEDEWAVVFESKVQAKVSRDQLKRHVATVKRCGYDVARLIVISVDRQAGRLPKVGRQVQWREVYAWFRARADQSFWARQFVEYMQVFEGRMIAKDYAIRGTITMFDGIRFDRDNPYTYREGKRLIRLLGDELQARKDLYRIGVDPRGGRRAAITGSKGDIVWDYLPLRVAKSASLFTHFPHLTMNIGRKGGVAATTVPHGVKGGFRSKLRSAGVDEFERILLKIHSRLKPVLKKSAGSAAMVYATQRHFRSQRSRAHIDARLDVDLRTLIPGSAGGVKYQPQWMSAIYAVLTEKRSNIQMGIEVHFDRSCKVLRSPKAVDLFAKSWIATSPLLDFVLAD